VDAYQASFAALADPTRRSILELLRDGPLTVADLASKMPVSRPAVSQHLAVLSEAHLVTHDREGTRHLYRADAEGLEALRRYLEGMWGDMLSQFAAAAEEEGAKTKSRSQSKSGRRRDGRRKKR
jgi:DNA-binding transcriptional ArsR family regulator